MFSLKEQREAILNSACDPGKTHDDLVLAEQIIRTSQSTSIIHLCEEFIFCKSKEGGVVEYVISFEKMNWNSEQMRPTNPLPVHLETGKEWNNSHVEFWRYESCRWPHELARRGGVTMSFI